MNISLRGIARAALPAPAWHALRRWRSNRRVRQFASQPLKKVRCGNYDLDCPASHLLLSHQDTQPLRDHAVAAAARFLGAKYPNATMIDIGANIGDTAAIMATNAPNPLLLVEPSDYYYTLLQKNARQWTNRTTTKKTLVSAGRVTTADVHYWGGTAEFARASQGTTSVQSERLSELTSEQVCFVKTDTDGYDFELLADAADWLKVHHPGVLLEVQIRSQSDSLAAVRLFEVLREVGYAHYAVWDDAGWPMVTNATADIVRQLNRYLMLTWMWPGPARIFSYDIMCLHRTDADVHAQIVDWCESAVAQHSVAPGEVR